MIFNYKTFNIGDLSCGHSGHEFRVDGDINPNLPDVPKVIQEAFDGYNYPNFCISFDELIEVCQEEADSSKKVPQSYLQ